MYGQIALTKPIDMETAERILWKELNLCPLTTYSGNVFENDFKDKVLQAMKAYAQQECEKVRQDCADNAKMIYHDGHGKVNHPTVYHQMGADNIQIDKQSIISTPITLT